MEDRTQEIFNQYDLVIRHTYRVRGALLLDTNEGLKLLCGSNSSESRLSFEDKLKHQMWQKGYRNTDYFVRNKEGTISTPNSFGECFVVKNWFDGEECSVYKEDRILAAVFNLAQVHCAMAEIEVPEEQKPYHVQADLNILFERRNREIKRVMAYIRSRKQKSPFEVQYLTMCGEFYEEALKAQEKLTAFPLEKIMQRSVHNGIVCHGSYNYHNVLLLSANAGYGMKFQAAEAGGGGLATTNFEKAAFGLQVTDLYQFLRKVMEKNDFNTVLAEHMLQEYEQVKLLTDEDRELLSILLLYPEKFWKITNFYYNSKKSWIPQKNILKLTALKRQQETKKRLIKYLEVQW